MYGNILPVGRGVSFRMTEMKNVFDDGEHALAFVADGGQAQRRFLGRIRHAFVQHFGKAHDRGQRAAQFMGGVGDEITAQMQCAVDFIQILVQPRGQIGNMVQGYIALGDGYRVGVCGSAVLRDGVITNLSDIISVVIRVPRDIRGLCRPVCEFMQRTNFSQGVLIYSPPGVGKTTLLRDTAYTLASEPYNKRIAIIDSRKELYTGYLKSSSFIDPYIGYPKGKGIELAIRTMAPDIIICDEIGNREETDAILDNQSSGVPIIASAHGSDLSALIMRENMAKLYKSSVFGCYMGISRRSGNGKYRYEIYESEEKRIAT